MVAKQVNGLCFVIYNVGEDMCYIHVKCLNFFFNILK